MWLTSTLSKTGPVGVDAIGSQIQKTLSYYAMPAATSMLHQNETRAAETLDLSRVVRRELFVPE